MLSSSIDDILYNTTNIEYSTCTMNLCITVLFYIAVSICRTYDYM